MATEFALKEAFVVFHDHRQLIVEIWKFFATATLGVLGFTVGSEKATHTGAATRSIQVGYAAVAFGNMYALWASQRELQQMAEAIGRLSRAQNVPEFAAVTATPAWMFVVFQLLVVLFVLFAIEFKFRASSSSIRPS